MVAEKKPLGDILVQAGLIGQADLAKALEVQRQSGQRLGEVLVALGAVTEADVARAISGQKGIPFVPDHELQVDLNYARLLPPSVARKTSALPLREEDGELVIAIADPLDVFSLDEIRHLTRMRIRPVIATRHGINKAVAQYERLAALRHRDGLVDSAATADVMLPPDPNDAPVVQLVNELVDRAIGEQASDIHIEPSETEFRVRFRVDGFLREVINPPMSYHPAVVARIKVLANLDISERRTPQDGRVEIRDKKRKIDLRVSTLPTVFGEKVVLRLFDKSRALTPLVDLGFSDQIFQWYTACAKKPHGMLLVTGPTGSGKTTTLMSTLSYVNDVQKNIVTIEDPVEYQLNGINHVQVNPKAGLTFADGLRSILRQDPNIIMIGEIRDGETADVAVRAALTGHLVLSTLHTNDAAGALTRLADMGVEPYLIGSSVLGVLAQRLVRRVCKHCRESFETDAQSFRDYGCTLDAKADSLTVYKAVGCPGCSGTGYSGRFPIFEFLRLTPLIQDLVTNRASLPEIRGHAVQEGMKLLITNGMQRVVSGDTTTEEILRVASFTET